MLEENQELLTYTPTVNTSPKNILLSDTVFRNIKKIRKGKEFTLILEKSKLGAIASGDTLTLQRRDSETTISAVYIDSIVDRNLPDTHARVTLKVV